MVAILQPVGADQAAGSGRIRIELPKESWQDFCRREKVADELWIWMDGKDIMALRG